MILAGGASRRFGANKALARLGGKPLIAHVLDRITQQTFGPIAINAGDQHDFAHIDHPIISDTHWQSAGPLAGIMTALDWARRGGFPHVVTLAVDVPFVPLDLIAKLSAIGAPAIAATQDRWHPVNALWETAQRDRLDAFLETGKRSAHGWAEQCDAGLAKFDHQGGPRDPFWNVNTPEEMALAEQMLAQT